MDELWGRSTQDWTPSLDLLESDDAYPNNSGHITSRTRCRAAAGSPTESAWARLATIYLPSDLMKFDIAPVAYFLMEIGLDPQMPTYAGGLGVLAGDTLRAAADLGLPMIGMTLLYRRGYFQQQIDEYGHQAETPQQWNMEQTLLALEPRVHIAIEGRTVDIRAWKKEIRGNFGNVIPVYLLDTQVDSNTPSDQQITSDLYGGDQRHRLCQEAVLGLGGVAMLEALGHSDVRTFHMNEGHAALLTLALLGRTNATKTLPERQDRVRQQCVFTTHTPVPAGHDQFPFEVVRSVLSEDTVRLIEESGCCWHSMLNMTYLALRLSRYVNGVAQRHSEISRGLFPQAPINSITNGVHAVTWTSSPFQALYDRNIPQWRNDNDYLRYVISAPLHEVQEAHVEAKQKLLDEVERRSGVHLSKDVFTIGFARRAALYKRADLLFNNCGRLLQIDRDVGPLQFLFAGKAHPQDEAGKAMIQRVYQAASLLGQQVPVVYLPDYDMDLAKLMCSGVDLWLNTPQKPEEASGTSGMKAALNGVPSLSVLDGWWIEGHVEGVTGWSIDEDFRSPSDTTQESNSLYEKLERVILPLFYHQPRDYAKVMRAAIALNGSFFNTQRMMRQYARNAYWPRDGH